MPYLPNFDDKSSSTKDKIIEIIARNPASTTKEINSFLKKQYSVGVTYQAVHKTLKQMLSEEILIQDKKGYFINQKWIDSIKNFVDRYNLATMIGNSQVKVSYVSEDLETIEVSSFQDVEALFHKFRLEYFQNIEKYPEEERILCMQSPHLMVALITPAVEYNFLDMLEKNRTRHFTLCKGETMVDRWIASFYNSRKNNTYIMKTGAEVSSITEVWIYPDKLIECFFPGSFWSELDAMYSRIRKIEDINYNTMIEIFAKLKGEHIKIVIHKDKSLIRLARDETLKQFDIKTQSGKSI